MSLARTPCWSGLSNLSPKVFRRSKPISDKTFAFMVSAPFRCTTRRREFEALGESAVRFAFSSEQSQFRKFHWRGAYLSDNYRAGSRYHRSTRRLGGGQRV